MSYAVIGPPILRGDADEDVTQKARPDLKQRLRIPGIDPELWLAWKGDLFVQAATEAEVRKKMEEKLANAAQPDLF